jgi:hypothetical protein
MENSPRREPWVTMQERRAQAPGGAPEALRQIPTEMRGRRPHAKSSPRRAAGRTTAPLPSPLPSPLPGLGA